MSKKNIIARVGNFEITKDGGSEHDYLRIKSVSGHWGVTYRDDNEMYGKIMAMVRDKEQAKHLELYVLHIYYTTNIVIDEQFALDFIIALEAMRDRMAKAQGEPTEEEEAEAIKEAEAFTMINDQLSMIN
ncbi:MAG: hypothetical protein K2N48_04930 [Muribaculaceae bacterium]|nr:hypothetical protein [Muribaculaceae bacterium]